MIAASVLFLAAAIATFLVGVFSSGLQMIGVSIGCSVAAALLLLVGVLRDSRKRPAVAPASLSIPASDVATYGGTSFADEPYAREPEPAAEPMLEAAGFGGDALDLDEAREDFYAAPATESYEFESEPAPKRAARKPAARKPVARKATAKKPPARKPAAKTAAKKTAKPAAKKAAPKKAAPKKAAARKPSTRKPAARPTNE